MSISELSEVLADLAKTQKETLSALTPSLALEMHVEILVHECRAAIADVIERHAEELDSIKAKHAIGNLADNEIRKEFE